MYDSQVTLDAVGGDGENCVFLTKRETLDTSIPNWYMSAQMEGRPTYYHDGGVNRAVAKGPYCYAYAFKPIRVSYDECSMRVSTNLLISLRQRT